MFMTAPVPAAPAERFALVIDGLCRAVAEAGGRRLLAGPLVILIWQRLRRLADRITALAARITAGRHRRVHSRRRPRPASRRPAQRRLPHGPAWLLPLVPQAGAHASQVQHLLADPEFARLVDAAPQMRRLLRPLCRMLGVRLPPPPRDPEPPSTVAGAAPPPPVASAPRPPPANPAPPADPSDVPGARPPKRPP